MENKRLETSKSYSEHNIDFVLIGKSPHGHFCLQFISNKPSPVLKSMHAKDAENTNIELEMQAFLTHECTAFMGTEQLKMLKDAIEKALESDPHS